MGSTLLSAHLLNKADQKIAETALNSLLTSSLPVSQTQQISVAVMGARSTGKSTLVALLAGLPFLRFSPSQCSSFIVTHYLPARACTALKLIVQDIHYEAKAMSLTNGIVLTVSCLNLDLSLRYIEDMIDRILNYQEVLVAITKTDQATNDEFASAITRVAPLVAKIRSRKISCQMAMLVLPAADARGHLRAFIDQVYVSMRHAVTQRELKEIEEQLADSSASILANTSSSLAAMIDQRCVHNSLGAEALSVAFNLGFYSNRGYTQQLDLYKHIMAQQEAKSVGMHSVAVKNTAVAVTLMPAVPEEGTGTSITTGASEGTPRGASAADNNGDNTSHDDGSHNGNHDSSQSCPSQMPEDDELNTIPDTYAYAL